MNAYPVLRVDQFSHRNVEGAQQWQSAMTYKFVGALKGITNPTAARDEGAATRHPPRPADRNRAQADQAQPALPGIRRTRTRAGRATDFVLDAVLLPSPYASSFGGFVELPTVHLVDGRRRAGIRCSTLSRPGSSRAQPKPAAGELPADMSTMSLVGGGLIAGDSLAALSVGIYGLLKTVL